MANVLDAFGKTESKGFSTLTEDDVEKDDLRLMEEKDKEEKEEDKEEKLDDSDLIVDDDLLEEEEEEEEKEDKKDEEETKEEEEETITTRGIKFSSIKEKYPEFAKTPEFKQLRDAYYREEKLTELFPTIEEATEAAENNQSFVKLNDEILNQGSVSGLLNAIKEANPEALKKVGTSFLDTLASLDANLYAEAITPVVKKLARNIYAEGQKQLKRNPESSDAKALVGTARNIMQWAFDDPELVDKQDEVKQEDKPNEKEKELEKREQAIAQRDYNNAFNTAKDSLDRHLTKLISEGLDTKDEMSEFVRDSIVEKIRGEVDRQIASDKSHISKMQGLWKRALEAGYDRSSLSRIISAYLERAKPIIPRLRSQYKAKALGKRIREERDSNVKVVSKGRSGNAPNRDGKINIRAVDHKKIDYSQTSDDDLMSGKIKLRG